MRRVVCQCRRPVAVDVHVVDGWCCQLLAGVRSWIQRTNSPPRVIATPFGKLATTSSAKTLRSRVDRRPHALRCRRHLDVTNTEVRQRVDDHALREAAMHLPSAIKGFRMRPQSSTAMRRRRITFPVSMSTSTTAMCAPDGNDPRQRLARGVPRSRQSRRSGRAPRWSERTSRTPRRRTRGRRCRTHLPSATRDLQPGGLASRRSSRCGRIGRERRWRRCRAALGCLHDEVTAGERHGNQEREALEAARLRRRPRQWQGTGIRVRSIRCTCRPTTSRSVRRNRRSP